MKYTRLFSGADGLSHFEDVDLRLTEPKSDGEWLSEWMRAGGVAVRMNKVGYKIDWHTAPRRQFVGNLQGEMEIETSGGETRRFGPGTLLLVEDTSGKGHRTRVSSDVDRVSVFLALES
jgi:hypothetical protein